MQYLVLLQEDLPRACVHSHCVDFHKPGHCLGPQFLFRTALNVHAYFNLASIWLLRARCLLHQRTSSLLFTLHLGLPDRLHHPDYTHTLCVASANALSAQDRRDCDLSIRLLVSHALLNPLTYPCLDMHVSQKH